jgi:hypothetical protein
VILAVSIPFELLPIAEPGLLACGGLVYRHEWLGLLRGWRSILVYYGG